MPDALVLLQRSRQARGDERTDSQEPYGNDDVHRGVFCRCCSSLDRIMRVSVRYNALQMAKSLQRRQRSTARRTFLFNVYPSRETLWMEEMIARCHHTLARRADLDVIHANDAVSARRDITHFDVAFARRVVAFNKSALREHVLGNSPMIVVHFWEYA